MRATRVHHRIDANLIRTINSHLLGRTEHNYQNDNLELAATKLIAIDDEAGGSPAVRLLRPERFFFSGRNERGEGGGDFTRLFFRTRERPLKEPYNANAPYSFQLSSQRRHGNGELCKTDGSIGRTGGPVKRKFVTSKVSIRTRVARRLSPVRSSTSRV